MQHDAEQAERFGAIHLVAHRVDRLLPQAGERRGEIDEIAAVREDGRNPGRRHFHPEFADFPARQRPAAPLAGVLREDLQRVAAVRDGPLDRARQAAGHRHVSAQTRHDLLGCYFSSMHAMFLT